MTKWINNDRDVHLRAQKFNVVLCRREKKCGRWRFWLQRTHLAKCRSIYNPSAPTVKAKVEAWASPDVHRPSSLMYAAGNKRPGLKQGGRREPTPQVFFWSLHARCGTYINMHTHMIKIVRADQNSQAYCEEKNDITKTEFIGHKKASMKT